MTSGIEGITTELRKCIICGKDFVIEASRSNRACSKDCGHKLRLMVRKQNLSIPYRAKMEALECRKHLETIFTAENTEGEIL